MTTTPAVTLRPPPEARPGRAVAARVTAVVMLVVGALAVAAAIGLIAVFGTSSRLATGSQQLDSSATAVVTDVATIQNTRGVSGVIGWPSISVSARGGSDAGVFVGIGRAADVDSYLRGAAVDRATDLDLHPFRLTVDRRPGTATPAPPADQSFWVASASSRSTATLTWQVQNGDYRLVVLNADGSAGLATAVDLSLTLPHAFAISLAVLSGGAVLVLGGVGVLVHSSRRGRRPVSHSTSW
jgi:hypothetical protein